MKHIVLIIPDLCKHGAERVLANCANYWINNGYQVTVLLLFENPEIEYVLDPLIQIICLSITPQSGSRVGKVLKNWIGVLKLRRVLLSLKPDLVISFMVDLEAIVACLRTSMKLVVSIHADPEYRNSKTSLYRRVLISLLYRRVFKIHLVTESGARFFHQLSNIAVISNFVLPPKAVKAHITFPFHRLVSVGRLIHSKRFDVLINAFSKVLERFPELRLEIYGEGPERGNLEQVIRDLKLESVISMPGIVDNIESVLLAQDIFIFPSETESFGLALCEAMSVGLVVVASDCTGIRDIVTDREDGRLFQAGNVEELVNVLIELLGDPNQCEHLSCNAKRIVNRFSEEMVFGLWDKLFSEVGLNRPGKV